MSKYKKFMAVGDNHGWHACPIALKKVKEFKASWKPDYRIHLGDVWDFTPLRSKASQDERAEGIGVDFQDGWAFLNEYQPTHLTLGNHDDRIWMNMEHGADGVLRETCHKLAKECEAEFKKRKIAFVPYHVGSYLRLNEGGPKLIHGFRSTTYPAKAHHENWGSCLHGHCHTADQYTARHIDGGKSFSVPCLADLKKLTYSDRQPAKLGHRNGFLYGVINSRTGAWQAWQVVKDGTDWISPQGIL